MNTHPKTNTPATELENLRSQLQAARDRRDHTKELRILDAIGDVREALQRDFETRFVAAPGGSMHALP